MTFLRYHCCCIKSMLLAEDAESHEGREYTLQAGFDALQRWDRFMNL